jgi:hypothetical protein
MKGDIAELLIYDRALSASNRHAVLRYLGEKYAVAEVFATNSQPAVSIASPANTVLQAPGTVTVTADASDADGSVVRVQFFINGIPYATLTNVPYSITVDVPYGGRLTLRTVATDNLGATRTLLTTYCVQGPSAPAGLVAYWPLNGNAEASLGLDGALVNGPVPVPDRLGTQNGAIAFGGAQSQRIEVPSGGGLAGAQQGTISMWVNWNGTQDGGVVNSFGAVLGRQQDGIFSANVISLNAADPATAMIQWRRTSDVTITGVTPVGSDTWRHLAVTFTPTNSELYVDGNLEGTGGASSLNANATVPLTIGAWIGGGGSYSTASIDDVAIWNRVLSASEIADLALGTSALVLAPQPDCLSIRRPSATTREIRWGSDGVLQHADSIDGLWEDVTGATSPYPVPQGTMKFYRLRSNL